MSSNLFTPSLRYTNKDTCNSAWTFIDGQNISDIEVPQFIKNLFTSFDDSRYGKMGKDLIEGVGCLIDGSNPLPHGNCTGGGICMNGTNACSQEDTECQCVATDSGGDGQPVVSGKCSGNAGGTGDFTCGDSYTAKANPETIDSASTDDEATRRAACCDAVTGKCSGNADTSENFTCTDNWTLKPTSNTIESPSTNNPEARKSACCNPPVNTCTTAYGESPGTGVNHPCNVYKMAEDGYSPEEIAANPPWYGAIDSPDGKDNPDTSPGIKSTNFKNCCTASTWDNYCAIEDWSNSDYPSYFTGLGCSLFDDS